MAAICPARCCMPPRGENELPVVGDWVILQILPEEPPKALVPQHSAASELPVAEGGWDQPGERPVVPNIDTLFLAVGLDDNYRLRRIERYLAVAWQSGADPVVLLTKVDLCSQLEGGLPRHGRWLGSPGPRGERAHGEGLDALANTSSPGAPGALLGSSGVGKSTRSTTSWERSRQSTQPVRRR